MNPRVAALLLALLGSPWTTAVSAQGSSGTPPGATAGSGAPSRDGQPKPAPGQAAPGQAGAQGPPAEPPPAPAPIVRRITVQGAQRYSESQILGALGQTVGAPLDPVAIDRGIRTLWSSYKVRAEVRRREMPAAEPGGALGAGSGIELLVIVVETPSDRAPRFLGNVDIEEETLRKWALLDEKVELFEYQSGRVRQRLLEGYRREGYAWAEVVVHTRETKETSAGRDVPMTDIVFEIREGPKVRVKDYRVIGNREFPDRGILLWRDGLSMFANFQLTAPWLFNWLGSPFVQETLDGDVQSIRQVYRERGYLDARVSSELAWNDDRSEVRITIRIDGGEPYVVDDVRVEFYEYAREQGAWMLRKVEPPVGRPRFSAEKLLEKCDLKPGVRYEEVLQKRDEATLRTFYGEKGHLGHASLPRDVRWDFLEPELFFEPALHKLRVTYRIVEGRPMVVREISFAGASHTLDEVLRREVSVFPGGHADQKQIDRSLSRIQNTGYFSDTFNAVEHRDPTYRFLEVPGSKELIDLEFAVEEGRVVEFQIAGGVDSNEGAFGLVSLRLKNFDLTDMPSRWDRTLSELFRKEAFHGGGQLVELQASPGTRVSSARIHFVDPDIFSRYLEPISFDLDLQQQVRILRTHDEDRLRKRIEFGRRFGFDTTVSVGFVHTDLEVLGLNTDSPPAAIVRQERLGHTIQSGVSLDFSSRDLDNLANPHRGWRASVRNTLFTEVLGSDLEYLRTEVGWDGYVPTGKTSDGTEHVLHAELDLGLMPTYGSTDEVPYTERFFLGGTSTLRGFAFRGAGDRGLDLLGGDTNYAAGGESYVSGSLEWLYPLYSITQPGTYRQIESLRGVLFLDAGALGDSAGNIDVDRTRVSAGFGIGLAYPLPIQLNFGFPLRRFSGDDRQTFSFSIGITF